MINLIVILNIFNLILSFGIFLILLKLYIKDNETLDNINPDSILFETSDNIENLQNEVIDNIEAEDKTIDEIENLVLAEIKEDAEVDKEVLETTEIEEEKDRVVEEVSEEIAEEISPINYLSSFGNKRENEDLYDDTEITLSDIAENAINRDFFKNKDITKRRKLALKIVGSKQK